MKLGSDLEPVLRGRQILLYSDAEVIHVSQIARTQATAFFGRFPEQLRSERCVSRHANAPHVRHAQVYLAAEQSSRSGELVPMHGACGIDRNAKANLIEVANLLLRFRIPGFGGFLVPIGCLLFILGHTATRQVGCSQINFARNRVSFGFGLHRRNVWINGFSGHTRHQENGSAEPSNGGRTCEAIVPKYLHRFPLR